MLINNDGEDMMDEKKNNKTNKSKVKVGDVVGFATLGPIYAPAKKGTQALTDTVADFL